MAKLPKVEVAIPIAPEPAAVVEAVLILKMEKVLTAVDDVAKEKALARSFFKVEVA